MDWHIALINKGPQSTEAYKWPRVHLKTSMKPDAPPMYSAARANNFILKK